MIKYGPRDGSAPAPAAGSAAAAAEPDTSAAGNFTPVEDEDDELPF